MWGKMLADHPVQDASDLTPWITEAKKFLGTKEVPGAKDNSVILEFWKQGKISWQADHDETAWCAVFHAAIYERLNIRSQRDSWSQGWKSWGESLTAPIYGCTVIFRWDASSGHIGWFVGWKNGKMLILGGNQSNSVTIAEFATDKVLAYRWPTGYKRTQPVPMQSSSAKTKSEDIAKTR